MEDIITMLNQEKIYDTIISLIYNDFRENINSLQCIDGYEKGYLLIVLLMKKYKLNVYTEDLQLIDTPRALIAKTLDRNKMNIAITDFIKGCI